MKAEAEGHTDQSPKGPGRLLGRLMVGQHGTGGGGVPAATPSIRRAVNSSGSGQRLRPGQSSDTVKATQAQAAPRPVTQAADHRFYGRAIAEGADQVA